MEKALFGIENFDVYAVIGIIIFFGMLEVMSGLYHRSKRSKDDWRLEVISFFLLSAGIKPAIVIFILFSGQTLFPELQFTLRETNMWLAFPLYILIDDCLQYWYHRSAHEYQWLWKLHRPHHAAREMGVLVTYRNAALYYMLMPNIWWVAIATFLGWAKVVAIALIVKQLVVIGSHSNVRWDRFLYKYKWLNPLAWLIEHTIVTPATHFAHHGKSLRDGVADPNGNFSNTFFFWDLLFGTAIITRKYPTEFGIQSDPKDGWLSHLLYPLVKSKKTGSVIAPGYKKEKNASPEPKKVELEPGVYLWCRCGYSKNQPFCDGSHHGTKYKPMRFEVKRKKSLKLCTCKMTRKSPYCDNSHLKILLTRL